MAEISGGSQHHRQLIIGVSNGVNGVSSAMSAAYQINKHGETMASSQ